MKACRETGETPFNVNICPKIFPFNEGDKNYFYFWRGFGSSDPAVVGSGLKRESGVIPELYPQL